jgi:predicted esterase
MKPAILCLHGSGTSAEIFRIQTVRLRRLLAPNFDFVFVDAPFTVPPGPGVLPIFEGLEPYRSWVEPAELHTVQQYVPDATLTVLLGACNQHLANGGGPIIAVMGFSLGARLAAGLMLEHQSERLLKPAFAIFLNGTYPPLVLPAPNVPSVAPSPQIRLPTLHVIGIFDPYVAESKALLRCCDSQTSILLEFPVEHRLPVSNEHIAQVASTISLLHIRTQIADSNLKSDVEMSAEEDLMSRFQSSDMQLHLHQEAAERS